MTLIVIARFFFVKVKITLVGSPKKRPAITKKNLAITKIFGFRAVFWHRTWISLHIFYVFFALIYPSREPLTIQNGSKMNLIFFFLTRFYFCFL